MEGLLQSKRFRNNLVKWVIMYVGSILLLTTVITYSKYISSFGGSDTARVAKFEVKIAENKCSEEVLTECTQEKYRNTENIDYYFTVDTTNIEVNTAFYLTFYINGNFNLDGIYEVGKSEKILLTTKSDSNIAGTNFKVYTYNNDVVAGKGSNTKYLVRLTAKTSNYANDIVKVGYSAVQKSK